MSENWQAAVRRAKEKIARECDNFAAKPFKIRFELRSNAVMRPAGYELLFCQHDHARWMPCVRCNRTKRDAAKFDYNSVRTRMAGLYRKYPDPSTP